MHLRLHPVSLLVAAPRNVNLAPAARPLERQLRRLTDGWPGAMLGALVYGAWAVFANWDAGAAFALRVGAVHWLMSTLLTVYGTAIMRAFYAAGRTRTEAAILAFVCGVSFTYAVLIGVHRFIGTPNLALTLAAGVIPTLAFCAGYALLLRRTATLPMGEA